ncbi:hypothetical protein [Thalassoglobus polymorphus]|uniref:Uncharacterized protein n=1 Tax=Thalassoglobus polymorphus TaxID=2527994 RepID=A0A517QL85_9PLAN|nr:hypothetical protein [Thalassoglobus polymorphus]QDT32384.1 hypothetical protein Mal48_16300 [Thalassoglobus polymorphus]
MLSERLGIVRVVTQFSNGGSQEYLDQVVGIDHPRAVAIGDGLLDRDGHLTNYICHLTEICHIENG